MSESVESVDLIKLPVSRLTLGMFVSAIDKHDQGQLAIANAGQIKHRDAIARLTQSGIKYVWVDTERSADHCGFKKKASQDNQLESKKSSLTREKQQAQAKVILTEAKDLIRKVLSETFEGKAIEVAPFGALADSMIESALLDADALKCMSALRSKDAYLLEHSVNVAFLLVTFGKYLQLDRSMLREMAIGGILHDIGKIKVDNKVLHKPGKLTPEEFEHMKLHQVFALDIMNEAKGLSQMSKDICLMHHEKLDGRGYPRGLKGDEIPLHGRMSCIVDIFDALTATRCYKEAMSPAAAFKILLSLTPFHLDQELVYEFIRCIGVYPVGSLVELSDGRVGIVWTSKDRDALHPIVKCFYSLKSKRYTDIVMVDLLKSELNIERGVSPSSLDIDPTPFY
ncbi:MULTISPECIES: HD-GYP domain-containing protein [Shewanella]|jgi:HD-GYP domain-containing protein (c-di-GMP phosphodiesterase class II)|uniref:Metal dependent phosphohydrolase n=3 Tax=Shewanella putrefaciens TaxID=24 RepID=E6XPE5_SHEP2|nr:MULTISPECIES: HD-GYP domain-containing protein [Shewanella]CAD6364644.1 Cyclic di-GMP phosphodiesterase [Shewanella hafniensis]ABM22935.1 metal dependent phosphohydrolase [Shewanella sp. W3-18-1]AVV84443.1 HD family phosphohydrolase [Shewanella putrefaciens]MCA1898502.1 HD-GYP domain-containing protein [Shewanella putrefaciens]MCT8944524.1 HD-GYP domain-containing protein [Shewanella putrefaciens]